MHPTEQAGCHCIFCRALFHKVKKAHPEFVVGETLKGMLADWSDTQLKGLEGAVRDDTVKKVMKGC